MMVRYGIHFVPAMIVCLDRRRPDRRRAGLLGRLPACPVLHRHPCRHAGLQGPAPSRSSAGMSVGPFPVTFQKLSSGFIPDVFGGEALQLTSLFLGVATAAAIVWFGLRSAGEPAAARGRDPRRSACSSSRTRCCALSCSCFCYLLATYRGLPNVLVIMFAAGRALRVRDQPDHDRPAHLCARRQREGGQALRHQDRAADLPRHSSTWACSPRSRA